MVPSRHAFLIELPFAAPIPRGHEVVVVTFTLDDRSPTIVVDRTASTLFCPEALWGPLHQDRAMVSTKGWSERYEIMTHLLVDPATPAGH